MKRIFLVLTLLFGAYVLSQEISYRFPKDELELGEPGEIEIILSKLEDRKVVISPKTGLLPVDFQILKDSIFQSKDLYYRFIKFQIFEEGHFKIPTLTVSVGDKIFEILSRKISVVNGVKANDRPEDIMSNKEIKLNLFDYLEFYIYVPISLLVCGLIVFIF